MKTEESLHKSITTYIKLQYPNVEFTTDMSGVRLPIGLAKKTKALRSGNGFPDILILKTVTYGYGEIVHENGDTNKVPVFLFTGLFLEVKAESPFLKDGITLKKSDHLQEQDAKHKKLLAQGYLCQFVWTFEQAKNIIDNYMRM